MMSAIGNIASITILNTTSTLSGGHSGIDVLAVVRAELTRPSAIRGQAESLRKDPAGCEVADVGKRTKFLVRDVDVYS
jgi:shikimate kinase